MRHRRRELVRRAATRRARDGRGSGSSARPAVGPVTAPRRGSGSGRCSRSCFAAAARARVREDIRCMCLVSGVAKVCRHAHFAVHIMRKYIVYLVGRGPLSAPRARRNSARPAIRPAWPRGGPSADRSPYPRVLAVPRTGYHASVSQSPPHPARRCVRARLQYTQVTVSGGGPTVQSPGAASLACPAVWVSTPGARLARRPRYRRTRHFSCSAS